jgi:hypothetical protein
MNWKLDLQIVNGMKLSVTRSLDVEAAAQAEVTIPTGATPVAVDVPGGAGAGFLLIRTRGDVYPATATDLTFGRPGGTAFNLDGPQLLMGSNALTLLGGAPDQLELTNHTPADIVVEMVVGGDATP